MSEPVLTSGVSPDPTEEQSGVEMAALVLAGLPSTRKNPRASILSVGLLY